MLLFGSISLLLAGALSAPAYAQQRRPALELVGCLHAQQAAADTCEGEVTRPLQLQRLVAMRSEETAAPAPRFYKRWRRVHGRWYRFTYLRGGRLAGSAGKTATTLSAGLR